MSLKIRLYLLYSWNCWLLCCRWLKWTRAMWASSLQQDRVDRRNEASSYGLKV